MLVALMLRQATFTSSYKANFAFRAFMPAVMCQSGMQVALVYMQSSLKPTILDVLYLLLKAMRQTLSSISLAASCGLS